MNLIMFVISMGLSSVLGVCVGVATESIQWGVAGFIVPALITVWVDSFAGRKTV